MVGRRMGVIPARTRQNIWSILRRGRVKDNVKGNVDENVKDRR
jgi:hypothetical protein